MNESIIVGKIDTSQYAPYFQSYIELAGDGDIREILEAQIQGFRDYFAAVSEASADVIHPPYAWTIKQVVGHMIDTEKIFGCRAHRIACSEQLPLPGFEQDDFVKNSDYDNVSIMNLVQEFELVRAANWMFFNRLPTNTWNKNGICDGKSISVRAIAFLLAGHVNHHMNIVKKRLS